MRLVVLLVAVSALGFAPAPFPKKERPVRDDTVAILGNWEFVIWEMNGREQAVSQWLEITRGKVDFVSINGGRRYPYELIMHPGIAPRGFEWKTKSSEHFVGSYLLEAERLTLIFKSSSDLSARPTDFTGKPEYRFVLRRTRRPN